MRALQASGKGLDDVTLIEVEPRAPKEGEIRLDLLAMTINPADLLMLTGDYGIRPRKPFTPGAEAAARVVELGPGVDTVRVGDIVLPMPGNCWTETMTIPAAQTIRMPDGIDLAQAAMLKANPATASVMLRDIRSLTAGDWVVQNAGNSAVGQNIVRIAAKRGLNLLSIVRRPEAAEQARAAGAEHVIVDRGEGPIDTDLPKAQLAFDAVGGRATERLGALMADGGIVCTYGLLSGQSPRLTAHDLVFRDLRLKGFWLATWFRTAPPDRIAATYRELTEWLAEGSIGAPVAATYDIGDYVEAIRHAAREGRDGKILLTGQAWPG